MDRKEPKAEVLRARCHRRLKEDVFRLAQLQQLDEADVVRMACAQYVARFNQAFIPTNGHQT